MATIKNNQLKGTLTNGDTWKIKTSLKTEKNIKAVFIYLTILVNGVYQTTITESFKPTKGTKNKGYANALKKALLNSEDFLGTEILVNDLKTAV